MEPYLQWIHLLRCTWFASSDHKHNLFDSKLDESSDIEINIGMTLALESVQRMQCRLRQMENLLERFLIAQSQLSRNNQLNL